MICYIQRRSAIFRGGVSAIPNCGVSRSKLRNTGSSLVLSGKKGTQGMHTVFARPLFRISSRKVLMISVIMVYKYLATHHSGMEST